MFGIFEGSIFLHEWSGIAWYCKVIEVVGALLIGAGIYFVNFSKPSAASGEEEEKRALLGDGSSSINGAPDGDSEKTSAKLVDGFIHGGMERNAPSGSDSTTRAPKITSYGNVQAYA